MISSVNAEVQNTLIHVLSAEKIESLLNANVIVKYNDEDSFYIISNLEQFYLNCENEDIKGYIKTTTTEESGTIYNLDYEKFLNPSESLRLRF